jgi:FHA domain-containing protein/uncharacterized protein DUF1707
MEWRVTGGYRLVMVPQDPARRARRASDADRDQVIQVLKDGSAQGRLSQETFMARVEAALQAKDSGELAELLRDLPAPPREHPPDPPPQPRARRLGTRVAATCSTLTAQLRAVVRTPRVPRLVLPRGRAVFTIGRAHDCDLPLADMTVSRYHAELRRSGEEWLLVDVGSTNGTRANGWRVGQGFTVRAGDLVSFGLVTFVLADQA